MVFSYDCLVTPSCPLCRKTGLVDYHNDKQREYRYCEQCHMVSVPEISHLDKPAEKEVYDLHENNPDDPGYRRFLSRLSVPLLERLQANSKGLDFGCGPGPALAGMIEEHGHTVALYDPFYFDDEAVLKDTYDFICATEVFEHLRDPKTEITRLFGMLNPGGRLAVMTKLVRDRESFKKWHYIQDPTHICFFSRETFTYLAGIFGCDVRFFGKDVIVLEKKKA